MIILNKKFDFGGLKNKNIKFFSNSDFERVSTVNQSKFREKVLEWVDESLSEDISTLELLTLLDKILKKTELLIWGGSDVEVSEIENIFEHIFLLFLEKSEFAVTHNKKVEVFNFIGGIIYDKLFLPLGLHTDSIVEDYFKISGDEPMPLPVTSLEGVVLDYSLVQDYCLFKRDFLSWLSRKDLKDCEYSHLKKQIEDHLMKIDVMISRTFEQKNIGLLKDINRRFFDLYDIWTDRFYDLDPLTIKEQEQMILEVFFVLNKDAVFSFANHPVYT